MTNDATHCRELAQLANPVFSLSNVFAGEQKAAQTAVHAFFASIQLIGTSLKEEEIARRKIHWWKNECLPGNLSCSHHPVLRELSRYRGNRDYHEKLVVILNGAERRLECIPPADEESFVALCRDIGTPLIELEAMFTECPMDQIPGLENISFRRGIWWLVCESFGPKGQGEPWWLPLNLMARAGLRRDELQINLHDPVSKDLYNNVFSITNRYSYIADISNIKQNVTQIYVMDLLIKRRLGSFVQKAPGEFPGLLMKTSMTDALKAWSVARRLSRRR